MPHRLFASIVALALIFTAPVSSQSPAPSPAAPPAAPPVAALTDTGWPRTVTAGQTVITVYQPQVDSWNGYLLEGRAAVAVKEPPAANPVYGLIQFSAHTEVDKDRRLASVSKFTVTRARFPQAAGKGQQWTSLLESRAARLQPIALDRLEAAAGVAEAARKSASMPLRNEPPAIIMSPVPAMLILIDGPPEYRDVSATRLQRVLNTRPLILRDTTGHFYLKIFDGWMEARDIGGPWTVAAAVPSECVHALTAAIDARVADLLVGGSPDDAASRPSLKKGPVPRIYVETMPSELIVTDGAPKYVPVEGTALRFVENTTGNLFLDTKEDRAFALVSGRWFSGPASLMGPWQFVPGERLPADFARIPDDSPKENVKASIPGTPQADEAVIANSVPQTARVRRSSARFAPTIDGEPRLAPIAGTELRAVTNASLPIIAVSDAEYFGVENGVWFVSGSLAGPWLVATVVPPAIYAIPPSSPLHYVTYVRIYDYTPEQVVVGYTPGYYGTYVSDGTVVFGTGYAYAPWVGAYWYGPPVTYGFGVASVYTPWSGWHVAYGLGWAWGATTVAVGWGWGAYPWWGPAGWAWGTTYPWVYTPAAGVAWGPRGAAAWGPGYWSGTTGNVYSRWGATSAVSRASGGFDAWTGNRWAGDAGIAYNSRTGNLAAGQRAAVGNVYTGRYAAGERGTVVDPRTGAVATGGRVTAGNAITGRDVTAGRATIEGPGGREATIAGAVGDRGGVVRTDNNVFAGHDGEIYRHQDGGGWEKRSDGAWQPASVDRSHRLEGERAARASGEQRWNGYRSGGFRSAGGARRRR